MKSADIEKKNTKGIPKKLKQSANNMSWSEKKESVMSQV